MTGISTMSKFIKEQQRVDDSNDVFMRMFGEE